MHADQVGIDSADVRRAMGARFPDLRSALARPVASGGTVVALFRVGEDLVARLPLIASADEARREELLAEQAHARRVSAFLSLPVPEPVTVCEPCEGYPGWWSVWRWLPGEQVLLDDAVDRQVLARDLAGFVREVRAIPTDGRSWEDTCRGGAHLSARGDWVRHSIAAAAHLIDTAAVTRAWEEALAAARFEGPAVTIHSDLVPGNVLLRSGQLSAVIDWGTGHVGDPAADHAPAWHLLDRGTRHTWCSELHPSEAEWVRGRGWALEQAIGALHYYEHTNRSMFTCAQRTLRHLLDDD